MKRVFDGRTMKFCSPFQLVLRRLSALLILFCSTAAAQHPTLTISVEPAVPLIEHRNGLQLLNFDFALRNDGKDTLRLIEIEARVLDQSGRVAFSTTVNSDGLRPGIEVVSPGLLRPGEVANVFNPFFSFAFNMPLARLQYEFRFVKENNAEQAAANRHRLPMDFDLAAQVQVEPSDYHTKTALQLPLHGHLLVWEGHDFFAHHRRIPLDTDNAKRIGIKGANANRYAIDLVVINANGEMFHDDPYRKTNYYTYDQPIYAPGDGVVKASCNSVPDNEFDGKRIRYPQLPPGANEDLGNFVLIDHQDGEFSVIPHMKFGSVRLKAGDRVRRGAIIGNVGFSGDAIFPHVHYSLLSGPDIYRQEGIPAYFDHVIRILGDKQLQIDHEALDTGDVVESGAPTSQ